MSRVLFPRHAKKLLCIKNSEGIELNASDINNTKSITSENHSTIILYIVWVGIKKLVNESFTEIKKDTNKQTNKGTQCTLGTTLIKKKSIHVLKKPSTAQNYIPKMGSKT